MREAHRFELRVYYEDTDLAGIVYYANYLKFMERGRTEYLRAAGFDQTRLKADKGTVFVVRRCELDFVAPARFDDLLEVVTKVDEARAASLWMRQEVRRSGVILTRGRIQIAAMDSDGKPHRLPENLCRIFADHGKALE